jgi:uncharacterized membrane protein YhhN
MYLYGDYIGPEIIVYIFKPLTMVCIITIALFGKSERAPAYKYWIVTALIFSIGGDIFLILKSIQQFFLYGLISFLIGHFFYIIAFSIQKPHFRPTMYALPLFIFAAGMVSFLFPHLGNMTVPVVIYMLVLFGMAFQAINRWKACPEPKTTLAAIGAVLFVLSDSILAVNRFYHPFALASLCVMVTYFTAQYLFARSV